MFEGSTDHCLDKEYDHDHTRTQEELHSGKEGTAVGFLEVSRTLYGVEEVETSAERYSAQESIIKCGYSRDEVSPNVKCGYASDEQGSLQHVKCGYASDEISPNLKSGYSTDEVSANIKCGYASDEQVSLQHVKCEVVQWASSICHEKEDEQQELVQMDRGISAFQETRNVSSGK